MQWPFEHLIRNAKEHHLLAVPKNSRQIWRIDIDQPALVLGSSQSEELIDEKALASAGTQIVKRRSGGGIVHLVPGDFLWIDVVVPAGDPLFQNDISSAAFWLGEIWVQVFAKFGIDAEIYKGKYLKGPNNGLICFASRSPGELLKGSTANAPKILGISQRRTKTGIWFQTLLFLSWNPVAYIPLLALSREEKELLIRDLNSTVFSVAVSPNQLTEAFVRHISALS